MCPQKLCQPSTHKVTRYFDHKDFSEEGGFTVVWLGLGESNKNRDEPHVSVNLDLLFLFCFVLFCFLSFCHFFGPLLWHMEFPRLGVESEL